TPDRPGVKRSSCAGRWAGRGLVSCGRRDVTAGHMIGKGPAQVCSALRAGCALSAHMFFVT
ncbi:unnamed protein product, partial [Staurois parvus]